MVPLLLICLNVFCGMAAVSGDTSGGDMLTHNFLNHTGVGHGPWHTLWAACNEPMAQAQARNFSEVVKQLGIGGTSCPAHRWLHALAERSSRGHKVFFDIGCNKGYEVAQVLQLWVPRITITPKDVHAFQVEKRVPKGEPAGVACGSCGDCNDATFSVSPTDDKVAIPKIIEIHCYEPSPFSAEVLSAMRDKFVPSTEGGNTTMDRVSWQVHNLAVSDKPGKALFPKDCASELCQLENIKGSQQEPNSVEVEVSSLDTEMARLNVRYIDMLKIDTEGNDPSVLLGAHDAFKNHKIGMVQFEYHYLGLWQQYSLEQVVHALSRYGMVCYLAFADKYYRLTGCWDNAFEFKNWSNVLCIHASNSMYPIIDVQSWYHKAVLQ